MEVAEVREMFLNKRLGEIILHYCDEGRAAAIEIQQKINAVYQAEQSVGRSTNFWKIRKAELNNLLEKYNITENNISQSKMFFTPEEEYKPGTNQPIPPLGVIASNFRLIDEKTKKILGQVKAGVNILDKVQKIRNIKPEQLPGGFDIRENFVKNVIYDKEKLSFKRGKLDIKGKVPAGSIPAQAAEHLTTIFAEAAEILPSLAHNDAVLDALELIEAAGISVIAWAETKPHLLGSQKSTVISDIANLSQNLAKISDVSHNELGYIAIKVTEATEEIATSLEDNGSLDDIEYNSSDYNFVYPGKANENNPLENDLKANGILDPKKYRATLDEMKYNDLRTLGLMRARQLIPLAPKSTVEHFTEKYLAEKYWSADDSMAR